jgi:hypothetical protein
MPRLPDRNTPSPGRQYRWCRDTLSIRTRRIRWVGCTGDPVSIRCDRGNQPPGRRNARSMPSRRFSQLGGAAQVRAVCRLRRVLSGHPLAGQPHSHWWSRAGDPAGGRRSRSGGRIRVPRTRNRARHSEERSRRWDDHRCSLSPYCGAHPLGTGVSSCHSLFGLCFAKCYRRFFAGDPPLVPQLGSKLLNPAGTNGTARSWDLPCLAKRFEHCTVPPESPGLG